MASKTDVYVDTSALIAALDQSDSYHATFARLFTSPPRLLTSALVIVEGHGWFLRRYDERKGLQFLSFANALPGLVIVPFDTAALGRTELSLRRYRDQKLTLADAHGLTIMQDQRIATCWSTDFHLSLGGAVLIR